MPISSLPSNYGIGTLGKEAYNFISFLKKMNCNYWQVLPIGPTSYGDSPYQSFSAFAGNPYFIDLDILVSEKLLKQSEINECFWFDREDEVNYGAQYWYRFKLLRKAYSRSKHKDTDEYKHFLEEHAFYLHDYALYMSVKAAFEDKAWQEWDEDIKKRQPEAIRFYEEKYADDIDFWKFLQFKFNEQWSKLKAAAKEANIDIVGDIPLYVSLDSADVWANPKLFELDEDLEQINVAGVPPDYFSKTGQRWGNPIYRWDIMENDWFYWWRERMRFAAMKYDVIRIDHFIGIVNYYSIPASCETAMEGEWVKGPGKVLMEMISSVIGDTKIIAEDLGVLTQNVVDVITECGYPGMKVLEFGMDLNPDNLFLPHNYVTDNCVAYIGTHDNDTLKGFLDKLPKKKIDNLKFYFNASENVDLQTAVIKALYASSARVTILQMQDILGLGSEARINMPSTIGTNWRWRMTKDQYSKIDTKYYTKLATLYNRLEKTTEE